MHRTFLVGGIASSLLYVVMNVVVAMQWESYSSISQTVSELSAVDAPTRTLWIALAIPYALLVTGFGWAVRAWGRGSRSLRAAGTLLAVYGALGLIWPLAPMHLREVLAGGGGTWTDTMHLVLAGITILLMLAAMAFGAAALDRRFRVYSIATMVAQLGFGAATAREAPGIDAGLPTPWIGVWERIDIALFLVWIVVLAAVLLGRGPGPARSAAA